MSIREQAKSELDRVGISGDDRETIVKILDLFFDQFNSGGSVSVMAPILMRCLAGSPLTPLTGDDSEWHDMSEYSSEPAGTIFQNVRASSVFKRKSDDGYVYYDVTQSGDGHNGFLAVEQFPYMPEPHISDPIVTFSV